MHQIWYTNYTTCTLRMANVQWSKRPAQDVWSIRPVQDVWLTYTAYKPCTPSIPYVSSVIYGLMYAPNFEHEVYDLAYGVWLTFNKAYDLHRTYGWRTKRLVRVHQVYPIYHRNVCTKFGTRSLRPVSGVWLTYNDVYDVYRTYGLRTQRIVRAHQVNSIVWLTYNGVYNLYRTYGWHTQHIVRVH